LVLYDDSMIFVPSFIN